MVCLESWKPRPRARRAGERTTCAGRCWCRPWRCSCRCGRGAGHAAGPEGDDRRRRADGRRRARPCRARSSAPSSCGCSACPSVSGTRRPGPADDAETRLARDGRPFPGTEVRAVDDDGRPVAAGEVGDAQVRGPSLFVGYARDGRPQPPELTADGFLPTGDLVRLNADGTINILGPREADHHPRRPQHRHQRGGGSRGAHPGGRPGVRRTGARRDARRARRGAGGVDRRPLTLEEVTGYLDGTASPSPSGRSSCSSSPTCRRTGSASSPAPMRSASPRLSSRAASDLSSSQFGTMVWTR